MNYGVVELCLRAGDNDKDRVLFSGSAERPCGLGREAHGRPGLEVDDLTAELGLRSARDEEEQLLLKGMPMPARRPPTTAKALEGDGEVLERECLPHEADLEVIRIRPTSFA